MPVGYIYIEREGERQLPRVFAPAAGPCLPVAGCWLADSLAVSIGVVLTLGSPVVLFGGLACGASLTHALHFGDLGYFLVELGIRW